jgi:hypothetical protein
LNWNDPLDPVVVTVAEVASGERPVLRVVHEPGHGGWQFFDGRPIGDRQPVIMPKADVLELDPTLSGLVDLPTGWLAHRTSRDSEWIRRPL